MSKLGFGNVITKGISPFITMDNPWSSMLIFTSQNGHSKVYAKSKRYISHDDSAMMYDITIY